MRYVIFGAGAVGGVIGGRLALAGLDVTLIARGAHLQAIRERGLALDTASGVHRLPVRATDDPAAVTWTEDTVVLLCVKGQQTAAALEQLAAVAPPDTAVVSVQNGVCNEQSVLRRFAQTYSICVVLPATHIEPGVVVEDAGETPAVLDIGRFPKGSDARAEAIAADLRGAGLSSNAVPDIMRWKYRKLINNLGNGVDAACIPGEAADELNRRAREEGESTLAAAGIELASSEEDVVRRRDLGPLRRPGGGPSSTRQSLQRGTGDVEIDYLAGEIVLVGRMLGVPTPVNELICTTVHRLVREGREPQSVDATDLLEAL